MAAYANGGDVALAGSMSVDHDAIQETEPANPGGELPALGELGELGDLGEMNEGDGSSEAEPAAEVETEAVVAAVVAEAVPESSEVAAAVDTPSSESAYRVVSRRFGEAKTLFEDLQRR